MEVHKHPHHVTHKKKWTEYLLEFLLLFLAVYLGFVSENARERLVEKERAHKLAKSLFADLVYDTTKLGFTERLREESISDNSSLLDELRKPAKDQNDGYLQKLAISNGSHLYFLSYSGTYDQIKNSGALRYFPDSISHALTFYEQSVKQNALTQASELNYININLQPFLLANINYINVRSPDSVNSLDFGIPENAISISTLVPNETFNEDPFVATDPHFKTHLFAHATRCLMYSKFLHLEYIYLKKQATALMHILKKEYRF